MGRVVRVLGKQHVTRLRRRGPASIFAIMFALTLAAVPVAKAATQCSSVSVSVSSEDTALSERICAAADRAVDFLTACGIRQTEPVRIEVIDGLNFDHPHCVGISHCSEATIELVAPGYMAEVLGADHPFIEIPQDAFYDSLVAHEMAHALAYQTRQGALESTVATEYIAYAIQMSFLPEDVRAAFLSNRPVTEPVTLMALNEVILVFSPADFAVRAWKHFKTPENGCRFIQRLLDGQDLLSIQATQ